MSLGLGINGINSYAYDPYFAYALNAYNPNFQGTQQTVSQPQVTTPAVDTSASTANLPKADYSEKDSNAGTVAGVIGTLATAGTLIYAYRKGKGTGEGLTRLKNGFKKMFGMEVKAAAESTQAVANKIRAHKDKNGKLFYTIPGKNKTLKTEAEINRYAADYGINMKNLSKFDAEKSKLNGYQFKITDNNVENTVTVKNGQIVDILNGQNTSIKQKILESTDVNDIRFVDKIQKQIADIEKGVGSNWSAYKGLTNIEYQTQIGDDVVTMTRAAINQKPKVVEFTTLERFPQDSKALKAYFYDHPEEKKVFLSETLKKGKIPEGMKVESFDYSFDKQTKCHYKNGKLIGITQNGKYSAKGSEDCNAFLADNEADLEKAINKIYESGELKNFENPVLIMA